MTQHAVAEITYAVSTSAARSRLARQRGTSLGELVRAACEKQYGLFSEQERLDALHELSELSLPVGDPAAMKRESTPDPEDLAQ